MRKRPLGASAAVGWYLVLIGLCMAFVARPGWVEAGDWMVGDVFVGVSQGSYQVYDNLGNFKETISDGLGGFTTGCAFTALLDKLYTTNFDNTKVVVYDDPHPHAILQPIDTGATSPGGNSESIVFAANGDFYVGHAGGDADIHRYNAAGRCSRPMTSPPKTGARTGWTWPPTSRRCSIPPKAG